jgi:hypothetical protein
VSTWARDAATDVAPRPLVGQATAEDRIAVGPQRVEVRTCFGRTMLLW